MSSQQFHHQYEIFNRREENSLGLFTSLMEYIVKKYYFRDKPSFSL
jgi:hypothetical protein